MSVEWACVVELATQESVEVGSCAYVAQIVPHGARYVYIDCSRIFEANWTFAIGDWYVESRHIVGPIKEVSSWLKIVLDSRQAGSASETIVNETIHDGESSVISNM